MTTSPEKTENGLSLTDPEVIQCPFDYYKQLRDSGDVVREEKGVAWVVHRYADIVAMSKDVAHFSSQQGLTGHMLGVSQEPYSDEVEALVAKFRPMAADALLMADPPEHSRHRSVVTTALSMKRVISLQPYIRDLCNRLIDDFIDDGHCEFIAQYARPIPATMTAYALGVDQADLEKFMVWGDHLISGIIGVLDNDQRVEVARSIIELQNYMEPRIADRRANPKDDLLNDIVNAEHDIKGAGAGPRRLTDPEIYAFIGQVLAGGNHTTMDLIGTALVLMTERPAVEAAVRADHSLIPQFLEEVLRYEGPIQCTWRRTTTDSDVDGVTIPGGVMVAPMWGAANKDPEVFADPDTFDLYRPNAKRHLTFGSGPHLCAGAALARQEAKIAYETLLSRVDNIRVTNRGELKRRNDFSTQGYEEIHIEFTKR